MTLNCFEVFLVHTCTVGLGQAQLVPYPLCMTAVFLHFPHVCPCLPEKHGHINWWLCLILFKTTPFKILLKGLIQQHHCLLTPPCSNQQFIRIAVYVPLADFLWCRLQIYCFYRVQNKITAFSLNLWAFYVKAYFLPAVNNEWAHPVNSQHCDLSQ